MPVGRQPGGQGIDPCGPGELARGAGTGAGEDSGGQSGRMEEQEARGRSGEAAGHVAGAEARLEPSWDGGLGARGPRHELVEQSGNNHGGNPGPHKPHTHTRPLQETQMCCENCAFNRQRKRRYLSPRSTWSRTGNPMPPGTTRTQEHTSPKAWEGWRIQAALTQNSKEKIH